MHNISRGFRFMSQNAECEDPGIGICSVSFSFGLQSISIFYHTALEKDKFAGFPAPDSKLKMRDFTCLEYRICQLSMEWFFILQIVQY